MIDGLVFQLSQCLLGCDNAVFVVFDGIDYIVISYAAFYHVVLLLQYAALPAIDYVFEPFNIIILKYFDMVAGR